MTHADRVAEAERIAASFRVLGYTEARAAPEYCIDELGPDGFYTRTVSVYVGPLLQPPDQRCGPWLSWLRRRG